jgi:hypothetical protein
LSIVDVPGPGARAVAGILLFGAAVSAANLPEAFSTATASAGTAVLDAATNRPSAEISTRNEAITNASFYKTTKWPLAEGLPQNEISRNELGASTYPLVAVGTEFDGGYFGSAPNIAGFPGLSTVSMRIFAEPNEFQIGRFSHLTRTSYGGGGGSGSPSAAVIIYPTMPYLTDFEGTDGFVVGPLGQQMGWSNPQGSAVISAQDHYSGTQSIQLAPGNPVAIASQTFVASPNETIVFCDFFARPVAEYAIESSTIFTAEGAQFGFQQTNGQGFLQIFEGNGNGGGTWVPTAFSIPLVSGNLAESWVRLTARLDFTRKSWDMYADGKMIAADIPLISASSTYLSTFQAQGAASSASYFDDMYFGATNPLFADANNDGIDDAWEALHGLSLLVNDRYGVPSGDGFTNLLKYIHGMDPGRFYKAIPPIPTTSTSIVTGASAQIGDQGKINPPTANTSIPTSGLRVWLEANIGVTSSNNYVSTWADQSGNGYNATQTSSSYQPTVIANTLNGLPIIQFTASVDQWLNLANFMSGATAGEVFVVLKATSATPSAPRGLWRLGASGGEYPNTDGNVYECFGSTAQTNVGRPASGVGQFSLYNVSAQSGQFVARIDGVTLFSSATNTVTFSGSPAVGNNGTYGFDGQIAEVIIYNRVVTAAERLTVGQYLQGKYNLPGIVVPANPTNLIVNPLSATETSLVWSDTPTNTGITYTVWRQTGSGGYSAVAQVNNTISYVDSGLTAATAYNYEISSTTFAGSSPGYSNVVNATTLASGTDMPLTGMKLWLAADSGV